MNKSNSPGRRNRPSASKSPSPPSPSPSSTTIGRSNVYITMVILGVVLRIFAITRTSLPKLLGSRVEVVTPITSFSRLEEGLYLYNSGARTYDGGVFHQAFLLLPILSLVTKLFNGKNELAIAIVYSILDVITAYCILLISQAQNDIGHHDKLINSKTPNTINNKDNKQNDSQRDSSLVSSHEFTSLLYLYSPVTLVSTIALCTYNFTIMFIVLSVCLALEKKTRLAMCSIGIASYLSLYPILLVAPLILVAKKASIKV